VAIEDACAVGGDAVKFGNSLVMQTAKASSSRIAAIEAAICFSCQSSYHQKCLNFKDQKGCHDEIWLCPDCFVVDRILEWRYSGQMRTGSNTKFPKQGRDIEYHVCWKGSDQEPTWEPAGNLTVACINLFWNPDEVPVDKARQRKDQTNIQPMGQSLSHLHSNTQPPLGQIHKEVFPPSVHRTSNISGELMRDVGTPLCLACPACRGKHRAHTKRSGCRLGGALGSVPAKKKKKNRTTGKHKKCPLLVDRPPAAFMPPTLTLAQPTVATAAPPTLTLAQPAMTTVTPTTLTVVPPALTTVTPTTLAAVPPAVIATPVASAAKPPEAFTLPVVPCKNSLKKMHGALVEQPQMVKSTCDPCETSPFRRIVLDVGTPLTSAPCPACRGKHRAHTKGSDCRLGLNKLFVPETQANPSQTKCKLTFREAYLRV
jgi:hypothetical protein